MRAFTCVACLPYPIGSDWWRAAIRVTCISLWSLLGGLAVQAQAVPAGPVQDTSVRTLAIDRSFALPAGGVVHLDMGVPVELTVSSRPQAHLLVRGQGKGYTAQLTPLSPPEAGSPQGMRIRLSQEGLPTTQGASSPDASAPVQVQLSLPPGSVLRGQIGQGRVVIGKLDGEVFLDAGKADLTLQDGAGKRFITTRQGNITCQGGWFTQAYFSAMMGSIELQNIRGQIDAQAGSGALMVHSPTQPLQASLQNGLTRLRVGEGDVQASVYGGRLDFTWTGKADVQGQRFDFSARQGELTLRFPDRMGLELNLDQTESEAATAAPGTAPAGTTPGKKMDSEFALGRLPAAKRLTHQGNRLLVTQGQQRLNGGGNPLMIHAFDSLVYLKKNR